MKTEKPTATAIAPTDAERALQIFQNYFLNEDISSTETINAIAIALAKTRAEAQIKKTEIQKFFDFLNDIPPDIEVEKVVTEYEQILLGGSLIYRDELIRMIQNLVDRATPAAPVREVSDEEIDLYIKGETNHENQCVAHNAIAWYRSQLKPLRLPKELGERHDTDYRNGYNAAIADMEKLNQ